VPVLARTFEAAGMSTVMVTMMPYWAEKIGVPRTVGLEFPFGHTLGHAGDAEEQRAVVRDALRVLAEAREPGIVVHLPYTWPDFERWKREWQPEKPAPIIRFLRERAEARRKGEAAGG
jgi:sugar phosphate isomerase/epimerase